MALASSSASAAEGEEIAFFDVETSPPPTRALLEFGAILVCPRRLVEVFFDSILVRPDDPGAVSARTARCNGITREAVALGQPFRDVADAIYNVLHGRVWAGHNIVSFDSVVISKAFAEIGRPPPQHQGMIDTYTLLTQRFGRRAGDMKLASLANYFGLGRQRHRSLDDVRLNLEVLKYCAAVLFLEASPRELLTVEETRLETTMQMDASSCGYSGFVEPNDVSTECIKITVELLHQFGPRTVIRHKDAPLQLCYAGLRVRFGVSAKFLGNTAPPKLNIVVDIPENLCKVLEFCDDLAQRSSPEASSNSKWRPLIKRYGNKNSPTVRLHISSGDIAIYSTDIYQKEHIRKLVSSKVDAAELEVMLRGNKVDAFFSLEVYDYQQNAGIRLVAKRLNVHLKWHQG